MEFFTKNPSIDRDMIRDPESDESSYGWVLSSPSTAASSKMHLTAPRRLHSARSFNSLTQKGSQKLAACRSSSRDLQNRLFASNGSTSSLSDASFDDDHLQLFWSDAGILESYESKDTVIQEESERIWAMWLEEDESPLAAVMSCVERAPGRCQSQDAQPRSYSHRSTLPSQVPGTSTHKYTKLPYEDLHTQSPQVPPKQSFSVLPPSPPPKDLPINFSHPQHNSWPTGTSFNTTPAIPRPRSQTLPSKIQTHHRSKLSTCMTNAAYPPRSSSINNSSLSINMQGSSNPPSPTFPVIMLSEDHDDFMNKMQKSVFEWDSDSEDERVELPEWLRKLTPRTRANTPKDPLARATAEFESKQKKKGKGFGGLGGVFKKSLRMRKSSDLL